MILASQVHWVIVKESHLYLCNYKQPIIHLESSTAIADSASPEPQYEDNYGSDAICDIAGEESRNEGCCSCAPTSKERLGC